MGRNDSAGWIDRGKALAKGDIPSPGWIETGKRIVSEGHV
jgi:hypothetical protein